jgi:hypothetical protein
MLSTTIQETTAKILKNSPDYKQLTCYIFTVEEGMSILNAVRMNKHLTECNIQIQETARDFDIINLIKKAIQFKIEENKIIPRPISTKPNFFGNNDALELNPDHINKEEFKIEGR